MQKGREDEGGREGLVTYHDLDDEQTWPERFEKKVDESGDQEDRDDLEHEERHGVGQGVIAEPNALGRYLMGILAHQVFRLVWPRHGPNSCIHGLSILHLFSPTFGFK